MLNFKKYPSMTKCIIPDHVKITVANRFENAFCGMQNLQYISLPNYITNIDNICSNCSNLKEAYTNPNIVSLSNSYSGCTSLTTAVCGNNVTSMSNAYKNCTNLTTAVCGEKVSSMNNTYYGCTSLTTAVCGDNVTTMNNTYYGCTSLTTAVCGEKVNQMRNTYRNCTNLTTAACGNSVKYLTNTYENCPIQGNVYIYPAAISNISGCFKGRPTTNILNIYALNSSNTLTKLKWTNGRSILGATVTWTEDTTNKCFYNTAQNVYIYPVANVEEARIANGD